MPLNVLDTFGLISASFGQWQGIEGGDATALADGSTFKYLRLVFDGDVLIGHRSAQASHLGNIAYLEKRRIAFDPVREQVMPA